MFNKRSYVLRRLVLLFSITSLFLFLWPFIAYSQQTCPTGQTLCGATCSNLVTDIRNCGACGRACPSVANGTPVCTAGICSFACLSGWANCDGNRANGCETNLTTDIRNCGACGRACPSVANGTPVCTVGTCSFACLSGWANCDGNRANGCETNLTTDIRNCGTCGTVCPVGQACSNGRCVGPAATGTRINLQVENKTCRPCERSCATGQTCIYVNGACVTSCQ